MKKQYKYNCSLPSEKYKYNKAKQIFGAIILDFEERADTPNAHSHELCIAFPRSPALPKFYLPLLPTPRTTPAHRRS